MHQFSSSAWLLVPLIAGMGSGWQAAANGGLRALTGTALTATLLNFSLGWIALLPIAAVAIALHGLPEIWPTEVLPYLGGLLGIAYVGLSAFLVRITGVLLLGVAIIAGQLAASLLLDLILPVGPRPDRTLLIGVLLALIAVYVTSAPLGRRAHRRTWGR